MDERTERINNAWSDFHRFYSPYCIQHEGQEKQIERELSRLCSLLPAHRYTILSSRLSLLRLNLCYYRLWRYYDFQPEHLAVLTAMIYNKFPTRNYWQAHDGAYIQNRIGQAFRHICLHEAACPFKEILS